MVMKQRVVTTPRALVSIVPAFPCLLIMRPQSFLSALGTLLALLALSRFAYAQTDLTLDIDGASLYSVENTATMTKVPLGAGQPSTTAFRISITSTTGNSWDNGFSVRSTLPSNVPAGHWYLIRFSVRKVANQANFDSVAGTAVFRPLAPESYSNSLDTTYPCDSTSWCDYAIPFQNPEPHSASNPPGLMFQFSEGPQTFDIAVTAITYYGASAPPTSAMKFHYPGRGNPSAAWKVAANQRIESIRKAPLFVRVVDSAGNPLVGASVKVLQDRHEFPFGVAVDHWVVADGSNPTYNNKIAEYFNYIALENGLKMKYWEMDNGYSALQALSWAASKNLSCNGHVILWGEFNGEYMPSRYENMSPTQLRAAIYAHVDDIISRTRTYIDEWDVINEPLENNDVFGNIASPGVSQENGVLGNEFTAQLFDYCWNKFIEGAYPKTPKLVVNDYGVLESLGSVRRTYTTNFVAYIRERTTHIHGFGLQSHIGHYIIPTDVLQARLDSILSVDPAMTASITELDISTFDEQLHADYLEDYIRFAFSQPRIARIIQWGFWAGRIFCYQCALFRENWQPKPAGSRYLDLVYRQWWTNATTTSNSSGMASVRAFYGQHKITASYGGVSRTVSVALSSSQGGATVTIQLNTAASPAASPSRSSQPSPSRSASPSRAPASRSPSPSRSASPSRVPASRSPSPSRVPSSPTRTASPIAASPSSSRSPAPSLTTTGPHSISPSVAVLGSTITITTRVNVGSSPIVNGNVGFHLAPEGDYSDDRNIAKMINYGVNIAALTTQTFTWTPVIPNTAAPGRYWLTIAVWDSQWNNIAWDTNLFTLTVYPPEPTIDRVSVSSVQVPRGGQTVVRFTANIANEAYPAAYVGYSFAPRYQAQEKISEQFWSGDLAARTSYSFVFDATISSTAAPGPYDLNIGVWNSDWEMRAWSESQHSNVTITVHL